MLVGDVVDELAGVALSSSCAAVVVVRNGRPEFIPYGDEAEVAQQLHGALASGGYPIGIVALRSRDGIAGNVEIQGLGAWNSPDARRFLRYCAWRFVRSIEEMP